jgi:hypothetical protein
MGSRPQVRPACLKLPTSSPGSQSALLRSGPLRTGHARHPRIRLKQAQRPRGHCKLELLPLWRMASAASGVYETESAAGVRRAPLLVGHGPFGQRLPSDAHPLLPLAWALRWVVGDKEKLSTPRAATSL